jgi:hypothetical protein
MMDWRDIPGFFDFDDIYRDVVASAEDGAHFVEVGVMFGKSTAFMGQEIIASGKRVRFDAIDSWGWELRMACGAAIPVPNAAEVLKGCTNMREAVERLLQACGVAPAVNLLTGNGQELAGAYLDYTLDFVFIDATHTYQDTYELLKAYLPKVKHRGVLAGHDYDLPGVRDAVAAVLGEIEVKGNSFFYRRPVP